MDDVQPQLPAGPVGMGGGVPDVGNSAPPQVQVVPQAPVPSPQQVAQQAQDQHDSFFGKAAKAILGQNNQYSVGPDGALQNNPIPEKPGQLFRTILGAALLGGAAGAGGNPAQGFAGGFARGGAAGVQQGQQIDQQKQQQAQQDFANQQKVQQQDREQTLMNAQVQQMHSEQVGRQHTSDLQDQEAHDKHNAASAALVTNLTAAGGTPAIIPVNGKAASEFTANDLAAAYVKDPSILKGPDGFIRHFVDSTDSSNLTYNGTNWVDDAGKPVNMTDNTTVKAIDVPVDAMKTKISTTGKDINAAYGGKLVDPNKTYQMAPLDMDALNTKRMSEAKAQGALDQQKRQADLEAQRVGLEGRRLSLEEKKEQDDAEEKGVSDDGQPSQLSKDIASGHVTVDRLGYLLAKNPGIISGVMQVDPNFDSTKAGAYPALYKDFTSSKSGSAGGTLNAAATAFKHLDELIHLNTAESHIPGTADYQRYENKVDTVAPELAKVYNDSTIPGIAGYKKTLNATFNRNAAIQTQAKSMGDKVDSLAQTWKNGAPSAAYQAKMPGMDDKAIAARSRLDPDFKSESSPENGQSAPQFSHISASGKFGYNGTQWVPIPGK